MIRGNRPARPEGNVRVMSKMMIEKNREIVWEHAYRHAADHPDYEQIPLLGRRESSMAGSR